MNSTYTVDRGERHSPAILSASRHEIQDGVLQLYDGHNLVAAYPADYWYGVTVEQAAATVDEEMQACRDIARDLAALNSDPSGLNICVATLSAKGLKEWQKHEVLSRVLRRRDRADTPTRPA